MCSGLATSRSCARCAINSLEVWCTVSTCAPDNSNWPPGSSEIAPPPVTSNKPMMFGPFRDRLPAEQMLHALEQSADTVPALVRHRLVSLQREGKFLVLGADAELRLWLDALSDPVDEFVAPLDRRQVDLITRHGIRAEWARP